MTVALVQKKTIPSFGRIERNEKMRVSEWLVDPFAEHCCMRIIEGGDSENIADRVAFIEKTPRVRFKPYTEVDDYKNWREGDKGRGGNLEFDGKTIYGYYQPSRDWCDEELKKLGYELP